LGSRFPQDGLQRPFAVHAIAFWVTTSALTPLVLLVGLLNERRRLVHDFLLGTVVINNERRAALLRHAPALSSRASGRG